ncbi:hypothetical protein HK100_001832, partial [Physocladia obscura]
MGKAVDVGRPVRDLCLVESRRHPAKGLRVTFKLGELLDLCHNFDADYILFRLCQIYSGVTRGS